MKRTAIIAQTRIQKKSSNVPQKIADRAENSPARSNLSSGKTRKTLKTLTIFAKRKMRRMEIGKEVEANKPMTEKMESTTTMKKSNTFHGSAQKKHPNASSLMHSSITNKSKTAEPKISVQ
mmetsp:Transcript_33524/g.62605  ORF Transcript_33524/g.62605 Transcript_33524/m.62605 type:complete len:121 (-) Transcript_33524:151-513(-)